MKSHGLLVFYNPPNFLYLFVNASPSLAMWGLGHDLPWVQTPNCNPVLIPNKPISARETSGSLFVLDQHILNLNHSVLHFFRKELLSSWL